jgi:serpin B
MKRMLLSASCFVAILALVLLGSGTAQADLCKKCQGMMFIQTIGTCSDCAGTTSSGAFKLCKACSVKLGQCEACRAPLGAKGVEGPVAPAPAKPADTSALATPTSNAFAANLYAKLAAEKGNLFFSPFSIDVALAMTSAGARGKTYDEMAKVLDFPLMTETEHDPYRTRLHQNLGAFLKDLNAEKGPDGKPRGYQLSVANALWGQKGFSFLPEFTKVLKDNYGAGLSDVDFKADTEGARKTINAWVERETRDKIKDLFKPGILKTTTRLVLANAIYFKGNWAEQFKKDATKDEPFHLSADKNVQAPLMNRTGEYGYFEEEMIQGLKLPYAGNELSMVILMPKKVAWNFEGKITDALPDLEKELTAAKLEAWMKKFNTQKVIVTIPKFKTTAEFELSSTLSAMGMKDAFTNAADLSGMNGDTNLYIQAVVHKAFVDVNEEGTEAAAATGVAVGLKSAMPAPRPIPVFRADHPFLFLIRHEKTGAILFMGRIVDPTK